MITPQRVFQERGIFRMRLPFGRGCEESLRKGGEKADRDVDGRREDVKGVMF